MGALSRFVIRHKLVIVAFWLAALAGGIVASAGLSGRLSQQVALPGVASYRANQEIHRLYGDGGAGYVEVVVVRLPKGDLAAGASGREVIATAFGAAVASARGLRVADYANTADRAFLTTDPETTYGL